MIKRQIDFVESIEEIGIEVWNNLAGTDNPFTRYEFLHALESSGSTTAATGWQPFHVLITEKAAETEIYDQPIAVMPLYLKGNSWGEYVFDWSWAEAYARHGIDYYPKFVTSIPFTPSCGNRILTREGIDYTSVAQIIYEKLREKAESLNASSWHVLFPMEKEHRALCSIGLQQRIGTQFHWHNNNYTSFSDFLGSLSARKRKNIRKERRQIERQEISFRRTNGADITDEQWSDFFLFYQNTYAMRGMQGYLDIEFFRKIGEVMSEQILLINAVKDNSDIAAALFLKGVDSLFGRYWGSRVDQQFLHFETCYYQGQEYAIENGIKVFDSGAQGEHKIQRGFAPVYTYSNHWLANEEFSRAVENFLKEEKSHVKEYKKQAEKLLPFKKE